MPGEEQQLRFTVLYHTGIDPAHYDLLIEPAADALLLTFRCESWPPAAGDTLIQQPDHRRLYLDYEGAISGRRGEVKRVDCGQSHIIRRTQDEYIVGLATSARKLIMHLRRGNHDEWQIVEQQA